MKKIIFLILLLLIASAGVFASNKLVKKEDHTHKMMKTEAVAASCSAEGTKEYYTCEICFKLYADAEGNKRITNPETVEKLPHTEVIDAATDPTCTATGKTEGKHCSVCEEVIVKQLTRTKLGHTYSNYVSDGNATCISDGTKTSKCDRCDETDTQTDVDSKLGHTYSNYVSNNNATCQADGTETSKCDRCTSTDTRTAVGSKKDHTFDQENTEISGALKSAANCESGAVYYKSCTCGELSNSDTFVNGSASGHSYTEEIKDIAHLREAATDCQTKESYWYDCANCDSISNEKYYETDTVGSHNVSQSWTTEDGYHFHKCTVNGCDYVEDKEACSDVLTDSDHKCDTCHADGVTSHEYGNWEKADEAEHKQTCNCGDVITEAHNFANYVPNGDATCTADGTETATCDKCGDTDTRTDADSKLNHNYTLVLDDSSVQTSYEPGASFNKTGLVVTLVCSRGDSTVTVTDYTVSPDGALSASDTKITVTYGDYSAEIEITVAHTHNAVFVAPKAASCTEAGNIEHYKCNACGKLFSDSDAANELSEAEVTVAPAHNTTYQPENKPSCTEDGNIAYYNCSVCRKNFADQNGENEITGSVVAEATGHTEETVEGKAATCTATGLTDGVKCSVCNATITEQEEIPMLNHADVEPKDFFCDGCDKIIEDESLTKNEYIFTVQKDDPFSKLNSGNAEDTVTTDNMVLGKTAEYYERTYGCTFTVKIKVSEATVIDLYWIVNNKKADTSVAAVIDKILVDGVDVTQISLIDTDMPKTTEWNAATANTVLMAKLVLKAGINEVTIVRNTNNNSEGFNNINIRGLKIDSAVEISMPRYDFSLPEIDPFATENGGYTDNTAAVTHTSNGIYYENTYGKTFSFTICSAKATTAELALHLSHNKIASDVATTIEKILVNGVEVELINSPIPNTGSWNLADSIYVHLASIQLNAGINTVEIVRKSENSDANNLNIRGIRIGCESAVSLLTPSDFSVYRDENGNVDNSNNPFVAENGGYTNNSAVANDTNNGAFYQVTPGKTFSFTIYSAKATTAQLYLHLNHAKTASDVATTIEKILVNGVEVELINSPIPNTGNWSLAKAIYVHLAKINLNAGFNTIEIVRMATATDADQTAIDKNNINIRGVRLVSDISLTLAKVHEFSINTSTNDHTNDPFVAENGGSIFDTDNNLTLKESNADIYRYGNSNNAILKASIYVKQDTIVVLRLINDCRAGTGVFGFSPADGVGGTNYPYIKNFTLNGSTEGVTPSDKTYASQGWNKFMHCELATLELKAGVNVISFQIAGDNINIAGLSVLSASDVEVSLAKKDVKTISILGDSISTYSGVSNDGNTNSTIAGNAVYYPKYEIDSPFESWWMQTANRLEMSVLVNNSWSGSRVFDDDVDSLKAPAAYKDRCVQLHDDNGTNVGKNPDIIAVYIGINDIINNTELVCGSFDNLADIYNKETGYITPTTFAEAYAIMIHKMVSKYADSKIFIFTLPENGRLGTDAKKANLTACNAEIRKIAAEFGCYIVDLAAVENYDYNTYTSDNLHPNEIGMDLITDLFVEAIKASENN